MVDFLPLSAESLLAESWESDRVGVWRLIERQLRVGGESTSSAYLDCWGPWVVVWLRPILVRSVFLTVTVSFSASIVLSL